MIDPFGALSDQAVINYSIIFGSIFVIAFLIEYWRGRRQKPKHMTWTQWFNQCDPMPPRVAQGRARREKFLPVVALPIMVFGTIGMAEQEGWEMVSLLYFVYFPLGILAAVIIGLLIHRSKRSRLPTTPPQRHANSNSLFVAQKPLGRPPTNRHKWLV